MTKTTDILSLFEPVSLRETERVKLMGRTDTKFVFHLSQLATILTSVKPHYNVLEIDHQRLAAYKTLYYDTPDLQLYTSHHNGKLNRYKVRHRTYSGSGPGFLEVKLKNNKGRTLKERIGSSVSLTEWDAEATNFLSKNIPYAPARLVPILWTNYSRITLVSKTSVERLTIDLDVEFVKDRSATQLNQLVIAEVKQERMMHSHFMDTMKQLRIQEDPISKYCLAVAYTYDKVKKNNFKEKLLSIQKIINHDAITNRH